MKRPAEWSLGATICRSATTLAALLIVVACGQAGQASTLEPTRFKVPFSFVAPTAPWHLDSEVGDGVVVFTAATPGRWLVFTTAGQPDIEAWVEFLTTKPELIATEPMDVEIGSAAGVTLDVRISARATVGYSCEPSVPCVEVFAYASSIEQNTGWIIEEGLVDRVWVVDVGGETVAIFAEASEAGFATWIAEVEEALAALEWA